MKQDTSGLEEGEIWLNSQVNSISRTGAIFVCVRVCVCMCVSVFMYTYMRMCV